MVRLADVNVSNRRELMSGRKQINRALRITLVLAISAAASLANITSRESGVQSGTNLDCVCPMVRLLANPTEFDGKRIRTAGFAIIADGFAAIYLSTESAANHVFINGILLGPFDIDVEHIEHLTQKWVIVEGTYHAAEPMAGTWRGTISDVTLLFAPREATIEE